MNPWRPRLHRWFAPMAARCPLSPNAITVIALLLNGIAAVLLAERWFLTAIWIVVVAGLADAFDGIVARVQNKTSRYGDFLDHFADRVSDTLLLAGWLIGNGIGGAIGFGALIAVGLSGYVGTQMEATWHEREYETIGRGEFVLALIVSPIVSHILYGNGWAAERFGGLTIARWMACVLIAVALIGIGQRLAVAARMDKP